MLYLGESFDTSFHAHHTVQICIGLKGKIDVLDDNGALVCGQAIIIPSNCTHKLNASNTIIASFFIDVQSCLYQQLNLKYLKTADGDLNNKMKIQTIALPSLLIANLQKAYKVDNELTEALSLIEQIIGDLTDNKDVVKPLDSRIKQVITHINNCLDSQIPMKVLADGINLSQSRLAHLFKEHVGIPIRRYSLWRRVRFAMEVAIEKKSLTEGAHCAGFSDSAHLSRIVKKMYGVSPSAILNNKAALTFTFF
jgi:AraC-like DNA-binding protein